MRHFFITRLKIALKKANYGRSISKIAFANRILFVTFFFVSSLSFADPKSEFKKMLTGLIQSSNKTDDTFPSEFRHVLIEHSEGLGCLADDKLFTEFVKEMDLPQGEEFLRIFDQKVADEIENTLKKQAIALSSLERNKIKILSENSRRFGISALRYLPKEKKQELLQKIPDSTLLTLKHSIEHSVDTFDVNSLPGFNELAPTSGESIEGLNPDQITEFITVIKQYFNGLPLTQKKKILTGFIQLPPHPDNSDKIAVALNGAGPLVQKLFQLIGKKHPNETVRKASQRLLESVEKVPFEEIRSIIENRYHKPLEQLFRSFDVEPLATATVGQVHRAELFDGKIVAVKVRKPGLVERVNSEIEFLEKVAPVSLKDTISAMKKSIAEEMDFRIEAAHLVSGQKYTEKFIKSTPVRVPKLSESIPPEEDVITSEFMSGTSLSKLLEKDSIPSRDLHFLCSIGKSFEDFTSLWLWRTLKADGFSHVDLHAGNIKVSEFKKKYQLELLDFGSTTSLNSEEVNLFVLLTVSALHGDAVLLERAVKQIEKYNETKLPDKIKNLLKKIVNDNTLNWDVKISELFFHLSNGKSYVPPNSAQFFRGLIFLSQHFKTLNELIDKSDPWKRYPRYSLRQSLLRGVQPYLNGKILLQGNDNMNSISGHTPYLMASVGRTKQKQIKEAVIIGCRTIFNRFFGKKIALAK